MINNLNFDFWNTYYTQYYPILQFMDTHFEDLIQNGIKSKKSDLPH